MPEVRVLRLKATVATDVTYIRPAVVRMQGYVYGEQPQTHDIIKLNTNENPYPPSPLVAQELRDFRAEELRYYPNARSLSFCQLAAKLHRVSPEQILATNGGDELLRMAASTFVRPGGRMAGTHPGYSLYPVLAALQEAEFVEVRYADLVASPAKTATQMNESGVELFCLANPHAPSGRLLPVKGIHAFAAALKGVLLLDEAYVDFVDPKRNYDSVQLLREIDNLLILRTLSKGYSLAGLRFGYGIGPVELVQPMVEKVKDSYNLDAIAQVLACAAVRDQDYARNNWALIRQHRQEMTQALRARGWQVEDSESNFVLARRSPEQPLNASSVFSALRQRGILVRYFEQAELADCLRISIGTQQQNQLLLQALDSIAAQNSDL